MVPNRATHHKCYVVISVLDITNKVLSCDSNYIAVMAKDRFSEGWAWFKLNPLSTNPTKWSNTLKQFFGNS